MKTRSEFFKHNEIKHKHIVARQPRELIPQETDWTCSVACIRTLLSGILDVIPKEEEIVNQNHMKPGPYFSRDIKKLGFLEKYDVLYGCDIEGKTFDGILDYMENGYYVMLESMYNYAHWMVFLGYYPLEEANIEKSKLLMYDPYYDQVRLLNADEFISMWVDGDFENNGIEKDFIAIR